MRSAPFTAPSHRVNPALLWDSSALSGCAPSPKPLRAAGMSPGHLRCSLRGCAKGSGRTGCKGASRYAISPKVHSAARCCRHGRFPCVGRVSHRVSKGCRACCAGVRRVLRVASAVTSMSATAAPAACWERREGQPGRVPLIRRPVSPSGGVAAMGTEARQSISIDGDCQPRPEAPDRLLLGAGESVA